MTRDFEEQRNSTTSSARKADKSRGCQDATTDTEHDQPYDGISEEALLDEAEAALEDDQPLIERGYDLGTHGGGSPENVPGFDLAAPMIDGIGTTEATALPVDWDTMRDAAHVHYGGEKGAESICGKDDRTRIDTVTTPPWRMIAKLLITAGDGGQYVGTGWFISPRTIMTAGHVVFSNRSQGWAKSIQVIPGMNERHRPFGTASSSSFRSVRGWTEKGRPEFDYGCIILPKSQPLGATVGYFGFAALGKDQLKDLLVNNAGYPADKGVGTQWYTAGRVTQVRKNRLEYMIDTFGGNSGSPVWKYSRQENSRQVVGIHNYGGCENKASRITPETHDIMKRWKFEGM